MAHIYYNRHPSRKVLRRRDRKERIRIALHTNRMRDAFAQLSPVDESRIIKRAESELNSFPSEPFAINRIWARLDLAYKYTCELLNTVCL